MRGDKVFEWVTKTLSLLFVFGVGLMVAVLATKSLPVIQRNGWSFPFSMTWDPVAENFGALSFIYGTVVSSLLAMLIAVPLGLGIAIFLSELAPEWLKRPVSFLTELLAAIPSVIFGLWGLFFLVPWLRESVEPFLIDHFGFLPFFQGPPYGIGMFAAGLILAIMILPIISSLSREVLEAVPNHQREAALALGATRWETTKIAVLRYGRVGLVGALFLALGRAFGETMAVTMVIGNSPSLSLSLFAPANTMASVIANEYAEASGGIHLAALNYIALLLFVVTLVVNSGARLLIWKVKGVAR